MTAASGGPAGEEDARGVEREVKIPVSRLGPVRDALRALGGELARERTLERNWVYDRAVDPLRPSGRLLRLRQDEGVTLTVKGVASFEGPVKCRPEHELALDGPEGLAAVRAMLGILGYAVSHRYEKYRELWRFRGCEIALDETPIGRFVEVEGESSEACARELGLDPSRAVAASYLDLYARTRALRPELPVDMVFNAGDDG